MTSHQLALFATAGYLAATSAWANPDGALRALTRVQPLAIQLAQAGADEPISGSHMMTEQERVEHQARMRAAKTAEERERIRAEHHEAMQSRARAQGLTLPDTPPPPWARSWCGSWCGSWRTPGNGFGRRRPSSLNPMP